MDSTSYNLLSRLRDPNAESAWEHFIEIYTPLIYCWARKRGLSVVDAGDLVQDVLLTLIQRIQDFDPNGDGRFRSWLRTITINRTIDFYRQRQRRAEVADLTASGIVTSDATDEFWDDAEYLRHLVSRELELLRSAFEPLTWSAAHAQLIDGRSAREVAHSMGMSVNAAYVAKSRVLGRLRDELQGLLE